MKSKVYIRVDGNQEIGLGHLVRCLALAQMLTPYFEITFACKQIPVNMAKEISQSGLGFIVIQEEEDFISLITDGNIVVLDGYGFNSSFQKEIKRKNCKLVCIDDLHEKEFFADLVINHSPGVSSNDYRAQTYTQFALGAKYALLRHSFLDQAKHQRKIDKLETILICFGGSDKM